MKNRSVGMALSLGAGIWAAQSTVFGAPSLAIAREGARASITFTGTLETAPAPAGPWVPLTEARSPFTVDVGGERAFYRSREIGASGSIFSSRELVELSVAGPLQQHFGLAYAGVPDGIFPPVREKPYFPATLRLGATEYPASLRVRGNSSLQECPFPKLKFKISKEDRAGTPFQDAREVKIGTHCAEGGQGNVGRLRDERAAFREALAYETMAVLGFEGPRVRRAVIQYRDTSPGTGPAEETGWQVQRHALLLDDVEVVAERLGGRALSDEEAAALRDPKLFDSQLVTDLLFLHALLGNWDYAIAPGGEGVWNTEVIELPSKQLLPVAGDFDLASWVTGEVRADAPHDYRPDLPDVEREAVYEMEQIRRRVSAESFGVAVQRFQAAKEAIESEVAAAMVDEEGRANALRHVAAFYEALGAAKP